MSKDIKYLIQHALIGVFIYFIVLTMGADLLTIILAVILSDYLLHNIFFDKK